MLGIKFKVTEINPEGFVGRVFVFVYGNAGTSNNYVIESYNDREGTFKIFGGGFYNKAAFLKDLQSGVLKMQSNV